MVSSSELGFQRRQGVCYRGPVPEDSVRWSSWWSHFVVVVVGVFVVVCLFVAVVVVIVRVL